MCLNTLRSTRELAVATTITTVTCPHPSFTWRALAEAFSISFLPGGFHSALRPPALTWRTALGYTWSMLPSANSCTVKVGALANKPLSVTSSTVSPTASTCGNGEIGAPSDHDSIGDEKQMKESTNEEELSKSAVGQAPHEQRLLSFRRCHLWNSFIACLITCVPASRL